MTQTGEPRTLYLRSFPANLASWIDQLSVRTGKTRSMVVADIVVWAQIIGYAPSDDDILRFTDGFRHMFQLDRVKNRKETPTNAATTTHPPSGPEQPTDQRG